MALRMVTVDTEVFDDLRFVGVESKVDNDGTPKLDRGNRRQYVVQLAVRQEGERADMMNVTVSAIDGKVPCEDVEPFTPVTVDTLRTGAYGVDGGNGALYFNAKAVTVLGHGKSKVNSARVESNRGD